MDNQGISRSACTSSHSPNNRALKVRITEGVAQASPWHSLLFIADSNLILPLHLYICLDSGHIWLWNLLAPWPSDLILCWATASYSHGTECEVWNMLSFESTPPPKLQIQTSSLLAIKPVTAASCARFPTITILQPLVTSTLPNFLPIHGLPPPLWTFPIFKLYSGVHHANHFLASTPSLLCPPFATRA